MLHDEQPSTLVTMARQVYARAARRHSVSAATAAENGELDNHRNSMYDSEYKPQQSQQNHQQHHQQQHHQQQQQQQQRGGGALFVASALAIIAALSASSAVDAAPTPTRAAGRPNADPFSRFLLKRADESHVAEPAVSHYDDAVFAGPTSGMRPMLPDKWSDIFLTHQERSFFPSGYGSGASIGPLNAFSGSGGNGYGMEKRRRGLDDTPQFVDNYVNLVEPGRLEWNFNRL